jgi:hypothetical protein
MQKVKKVINLAESTNTVMFRQTFNRWSMNWEVPKRMCKEGKWVAIEKERLTPVVTKHEGYRFALWRMRKIMLGRIDENRLPVWKVNKVSTTHITRGGIKYSIFQFDCHRITHGIVGGMNTTGGA